MSNQPNLVFIFADQWRADACGYAGDPNVKTPHLDRFAVEGINLKNAVSGSPVCTPYRATLMTGQYPWTHGIFLNDLCLSRDATSIAQAFKAGGYRTAYIGKWHIDGHGRSDFIPPARRQGFEYWKVLECTHNYNESYYYEDGPEKLKWDGYDAIAQTKDAQDYIKKRERDKPFALFLSWGPPHAPYLTAPQKYRDIYDSDSITLRPNVPEEMEEEARRDTAGYYAHCTALDDCFSELRQTLKDEGIEEDTVLVFTSDHGDMIGCQGQRKKQRPWEESIRVPFLIRHPNGLGTEGKELEGLINSQDIMPTMLGLCGVEIPVSVEGLDYSDYLRGGENPGDDAALLSCVSPFGQFTREMGGREFRGVRTRRYTFVRSLDGPWLLYDNEMDPYQLENLCGRPEHTELQSELDTLLDKKLEEANDEFLPGEEYIRRWGYKVDETGTVGYRN